MRTVEDWLASDHAWNLEGLVAETNIQLPAYLPSDYEDGRLRDEITPRLVRYYTTQGLLDEPRKEGREARYTPRHLIQLLLVRRLMAEGYSSGALTDLARQKTDHELLAMLQSGATLIPTVANSDNPALDYVKGLRRSSGEISHPAPKPAPDRKRLSLFDNAGAKAVAGTTGPPRWYRYEIAPGLELHVSETFKPPKTPAESVTLMEAIRQRLKETNERRK